MNMNKHTTFYDDALEYLRYSIESKREPSEILNTLLHDISGIARGEGCFLPRVTGWAKAKKSYPSSYLRKGEKP